ncbi:MAG TPA: methyltransferase [Chondromyces sp.]|nr:methyltransferase [Chondromyces sp.]
MKEQFYDGLLHIKTGGGAWGFNQSFHYHPYEPTPYSALEEWLKRYELKTSDRLVDFGCGKGRLAFFINYVSQATVIGIEMNEEFYRQAVENRSRYMKKMKHKKNQIEFHLCLAENYQIHPLDNRFYFFNPFSIQIFMNVINNILVSVEHNKRDVELILYYSSEDYIYFLESHTSFELKEEIIVPDLYEQNPNERFLIYQLAY